MLAVDAVVAAVGERAAVACRGVGFMGAGIGGEQAALGVLGRAGDDVDHAVDRIAAPQGAAGAADHLDPVDVLEHHVLGFPEHARKERRVDGATVDQHQHLLRRRCR